jgi:Ferritin-like domain
VEKRTAAPRTAPPTSPPASAPVDSAPVTTEEEAPLRPTDADIELLGFAQSFELTARDLYQAALDGGLADGDLADVFTALRDNHGEYANRLSGILGVDAQQQRDDALFDELVGSFEGGDLTAVATAGRELEATAVATHSDLIGRLEGIDGIAAVASIVVVEARQGAVLADVAGDGDDLDAILRDEAEPLEVPAANGWRTP